MIPFKTIPLTFGFPVKGGSVNSNKSSSANGNMDYIFASGRMEGLNASGRMEGLNAAGRMDYLNGDGAQFGSVHPNLKNLVKPHPKKMMFDQSSHIDGFSNFLGIGDACGMRPLFKKNRAAWDACKAGQQSVELEKAKSDSALAAAVGASSSSSGMATGTIVAISVGAILLIGTSIFLIKRFKNK